MTRSKPAPRNRSYPSENIWSSNSSCHGWKSTELYRIVPSCMPLDVTAVAQLESSAIAIDASNVANTISAVGASNDAFRQWTIAAAIR